MECLEYAQKLIQYPGRMYVDIILHFYLNTFPHFKKVNYSLLKGIFFRGKKKNKRSQMANVSDEVKHTKEMETEMGKKH